MASRAVTPTLAICLAAALAAGIGLARPGSEPSPAAPTTVTEVPADGATGRYGDGSSTAPAGNGTASAVTIENFAFSGQTVVTPGATVEVTNSDETQHTLTASDGSFDTGPIDGGSTGTFVAPTEPGTYEFFCEIHPSSMTGSLVVQS